MKIKFVFFIFMLHVIIPTFVYATQCCMHGPLIDHVRRCTTVSTKAECDGKPKGTLGGKTFPNDLRPGIGSGTGNCTSETVCCSAGVGSSSNVVSKIDLQSQCFEERLLVELSNFSAMLTKKGVLLNWKTETELDSQGFYIWRAIPDFGRYCGCSRNLEDYIKISMLDKLIPAKGNKVSGAEYSYLDKEAKPGMAYCYALEDIDSKGESKLYFDYIVFTPDGASE